MVLSSVELDDETKLKVNMSGISLRNLIKMGLNSIEKNRFSNEETKQMQKNITALQQEIRRLNLVILQIQGQMSNSGEE